MGRTDSADAVKQQLAALLKERDKNDQNLVTAMELNNRGAALEKSGDHPRCGREVPSALELYPDHVGIRTNLAVALLKLHSGTRAWRNCGRRRSATPAMKFCKRHWRTRWLSTPQSPSDQPGPGVLG